MEDKKKYRRWAVVYILLALLLAAVLVLLIVAGVYKTLVGAVVYVHPKGRYIVAECGGVRETFFPEEVVG